MTNGTTEPRGLEPGVPLYELKASFNQAYIDTIKQEAAEVEQRKEIIRPILQQFTEQDLIPLYHFG